MEANNEHQLDLGTAADTAHPITSHDDYHGIW